MTRCWCGGRTENTLFGRPSCVDSAVHDPAATGAPAYPDRLYIAGPMSGYQDCNYPAFDRAADFLRASGFEVVNPAENAFRGHYVDFLREDLRRMLDCGGVCTLDEWWLSAGARTETAVAGLLRLPVRSLLEWISLGPVGLLHNTNPNNVERHTQS